MSLALAALVALSPASATAAHTPVRAAAPPAQDFGYLLTVNTTGDGARVNGTFCDTDIATAGDQCSLRAAIQAANSSSGPDGIDFAIPTSEPNCDPVTGKCTINLTQALPAINSDLDINGPGADKLTVRRDAVGGFRIFDVTTTGTVNFSGLTITGGSVADSKGGGIQNAAGGTVNVSSSALTGNQSCYGGGIANASTGTVNITKSTFAGNEAGYCPTVGSGGGGGVSNGSGTVLITDSTFDGNFSTTEGSGGAIHSFGTPAGTVTVNNSTLINNRSTNDSGGAIWNAGPLNIARSTFSQNTALGGTGGAIYNRGQLTLTNSSLLANRSIRGGGIINDGSFGGGSTADITNSTISGNIASSASQGGGILNGNGGTVNLTNSTVTENRAETGGGIYNGGSTSSFNVKSTIVALNFARSALDGLESEPDASGDFNSAGFNLVGKSDGSSGFALATDRTGTIASPLNPGLDPAGARDNGGPTPTIALLPDSPAVDKGTSAGLTGPLSTDQRGGGFKRAVNDPFVPNAPGGDAADIGAFEIPPVVKFSSAAYSVGEGTASATITVRRTGPAGGTATVKYFTANGTALATKDYTAAAGTLSFAAGEVSKTFAVSVLNDALDEADETVNLKLGSPTGGVSLGRPSAATLKIVDNDPAPALSVNNATVTEGNAGAVNATFTVTLNAVSGKTVTVKYATANGTAHAPGDYTARSGTLIFSPGQTVKPVAISVRGDLLDEANETFFLNLSAPVNATVSDAQGLGTITDTDPAPSLAVNDVSITEIDSATNNVTLTVKLSAPSGQTVSVNFATANGTASSSTDYVAKTGTLTFAAGQTTKTIVVQVRGDTVREANETFVVNLGGAVNATISDAQGQVTILNDD